MVHRWTEGDDERGKREAVLAELLDALQPAVVSAACARLDIGAKASTVAEFANAHNISRSQAYLEISAGRLVARKVGSRTLITAEDAAAWRQSLPKLTPAER